MSDRDLKYDVEYDAGFREQVATGDINPLCGLRILVNGEDLAGAPAGESYIDDYMFYHFRKIVSNLPAVLDGERAEVQLYNIADYLVLEPKDDAVLVSLQSPTEVADQSERDGRTISKSALVEGITNAVCEFCSQLESVNPELTEGEHIMELREAAAKLNHPE